MIKLVNIHKLYETDTGGFLALKDVNLDFKEQEFVCVLGKSGSGKTTLLNIIGGLDKPSAGHMVIDGVLTTKFTERQWDYFRNYKIGFVFQNYSLIEHLTVLDNVMLSVKLQGESKKDARERALKLLEQVGVLDQKDKLPKHLSGGQRQRVAIARALVNDPEIILADEPTGALDKKNSQEVLDLLKELSRDKLVIMVTHNRRLAKIYADRIIELKDGVVDRDTRPDVIEKVKIRKAENVYTTFKLVDKIKHGLKNLRMKKVRTFLTALGLSIGVIGYILIDALSNGLKENIERQRYAYDNYPHLRVSNYSDQFEIPSSLDSELEKILQHEYVKAAHFKNDTYFEMTGLDGDSFQYQPSIQLMYPYISDSTETQRYFGKIYGDGRWPEADDEIAITVSTAQLLYDYSNVATLWDKLKGSKLHIATDFYYQAFGDESIEGCVRYPFIDEKTVPEGYDEERFGSFSSQIERQKELFKNPIISWDYGYFEPYYEYDEVIKEPTEFIFICDNYFKLPLRQGEVKESKAFKIVGIIESSHVSQSIITKDAYDALFVKPEFELNRRNDGSIERITFVTNYDIYLHDGVTDQQKAQLKQLLSNEFDYVFEYRFSDFDLPIYTIAIDLVSFIMNVIMFVSVITAGIMLLMVLFISVMERSREIGILRSLGATKSDILSIFTVESGLIGFFAGVLGIVLSIVISIGANLFIQYRYKNWLLEVFNRSDIRLFMVRPGYAIFAALLCIVFAVIFGLLPAIKASKKSPINALRRIK